MRLYAPIISLFAVAVAPALILLAIPAHFFLNPSVDVILGASALYWMAALFWHAWRYLPCVDFVRIRSKRGNILVDILNDRKAPTEFAEFLEALRARIESSAIS
jgi:hypothetical protein